MKPYCLLILWFVYGICNAQEIKFRAPAEAMGDEDNREAIDKFLAGDSQAAKTAFMKLARTDAGAAAGNNNLAMVALSEDNYPKAESLLKKATQKDTTLYNLALVEGLRGNYEAASRHLQQSPSDISESRDFNLGVFAARSGDLATAQAAFESAIAKDAGNPDLLLSQAVILEEAGQQEEALRILEELFELSSVRADAHLLAGKIHAENEHPADAAFHFEASMKYDSGNELAMSGLANALLDQEKSEEAFKLYKKLAQKNPQKMEYALHMADAKVQEGNYKKAIDLYHKASQKHPNRAAIYNHTGQLMMKMGRYEDAIDAHRVAARLEKDNADYGQALGMSHYFNRDFEDALVYLEEAIKLDPSKSEDYETKVALGFSNSHLGNLDAAIRHFEEAVTFEEIDEDAYSGLGLAYHFMGDIGPALTNYKKALSINPDNDQTYVNMGNLYQKAGSYERAMDAYKSALKRNPDAYLAYNGLGNTYRTMEELELSIDAYEKALELAPDEGFLHNNLAVSFYYLANVKDRFGHPDQAQELYRKSIESIDRGRELDASFGIHYLNNRGVVRKDMGDFAGARRDFDVKANMATANNDGIVYALEGDLERAYQAFTEAIGHDPSYPEAYYNRAMIAKELGWAEQAMKDKVRLQELDFNPRQNPYQKDKYFSTLWYLTFEEFIPEAEIEPSFELAYEAPEVAEMQYDFVLMSAASIEELEEEPPALPTGKGSSQPPLTNTPTQAPPGPAEVPTEPIAEQPKQPTASGPPGKSSTKAPEPTELEPPSEEGTSEEPEPTPETKRPAPKKSVSTTSSAKRKKARKRVRRPKRTRKLNKKPNSWRCPEF